MLLYNDIVTSVTRNKNTKTHHNSWSTRGRKKKPPVEESNRNEEEEVVEEEEEEVEEEEKKNQSPAGMYPLDRFHVFQPRPPVSTPQEQRA